MSTTPDLTLPTAISSGWLLDSTGGYAAPFVLCAAVQLFGAVVWFFFGTADRLID